MRQLQNVWIIFILFVTACFTSCDDKDENVSGDGINRQSWTEGTALNISVGNALSVTFTAQNQWSASTNADWCKILTPTGEAGKSTLSLIALTATSTARTTSIQIKVKGYAPVSFSITQTPENEKTGDVNINSQVDAYLRKMYLWNDEYKTLDLDFSQNYEDFFYGALESMTTNTLDKKLNSYGEYTLFSYIEKRAKITAPRNTKLVEKELRYLLGITGMAILNIENIGYCFVVQGVYPTSPAAQQGIKRGTIITKVDGRKITKNNYENLYYALLSPPSSVFTVELTDINEAVTTVTSQAMYANPVIYKQVKEVNGHKIGYLVYSEFDAGFDEELFEAFKYFKNQRITDLVLDLRYNGGGHTISANLVATCIAGAASKGKIFTQFRYNEERMRKEYNNKRPSEAFDYSYYENLGTSLAEGSLDLPRVYCLVSYNTASASELVINSLQGIDVEIILIGEQTRGKNVGMEYTEFTNEGDTYRVVPISFQTYNAKDYGDYSNGFTPTLKLDETNPQNQENTFYKYREYGTNEEPLYAAAIKMITGKDVFQKGARSVGTEIKGKVYTLPQVCRPGYDGMLYLYKEKAELKQE